MVHGRAACGAVVAGPAQPRLEASAGLFVWSVYIPIVRSFLSHIINYIKSIVKILQEIVMMFRDAMNTLLFPLCRRVDER